MIFRDVAWQEFERAAAFSSWLPLGCRPEAWADDVCRWLRDGPQASVGDPVLLATLRHVTPLAEAYLKLCGGGRTDGADMEALHRAQKLLGTLTDDRQPIGRG